MVEGPSILTTKWLEDVSFRKLWYGDNGSLSFPHDGYSSFSVFNKCCQSGNVEEDAA